MTKFEVLTSITDTKTFSDLVFDILRQKKTAKEIEDFLNEDFPEKEMDGLKAIIEKGYPLSLKGSQTEEL